MWLVVHVPKTAGTSFRHALEQYFGPDNVIRDYGRNAAATTEVVRNHLYKPGQARPLDELVQELSGCSRKVLVGHFPASKYGEFFEPQKMISFVRDPLIRTCSEFMHRKRNTTFDGSFSEFISTSSMINVQSRFLRGIPVESMVGLTERYCESLKYINETFQLELRAMKRNIGKKGGGQKLAENLSGHELELFHKLNGEDLELYKSATQRFDDLKIPKSKGNQFMNWWNGR